MARTKKPGKKRYGAFTYLAAGAAVVLLALIAIVTFNTSRLEAEPLAEVPLPSPPIDPAAVGRLSAAIKIATVSSDAGPPSPESLAALAELLERSFPLVHRNLQREQVGGGSLLFTWLGTDSSAPALLLAAHQDVVPIDAGSKDKWSHPPFAGVVADGFVWGRGTIDDKGSLMAILEAAERQLARGFRPRQTIYLAFGHDEEIGGRGAHAMATLLQNRRARVGLALDEGFAVVEDALPGINRPIAFVGIGEKGYASFELTAAGAGGHSSAPSSDNPAVRIARAVTRVADNPLPARIDGATGEMLDAVAPYTSGMMRVALANRWLTDPLIKRQLLKAPTVAPSIQTTTAPTIVQAGTKENVLPQRARAVVNHRILPGDTVASVMEHDRRAIDDPKVRLRALPFKSDPSKLASTSSPNYQHLSRVIRDRYPHVVIAPALVFVATDGRHYQELARTVLRFAPITLGRDDLSRFHGNDERIGISDYMRAIGFYERLITWSP